MTIRVFTKRPPGWLSLLFQRPGCTLSPTRGSSAVDFAASLPAADIPGHSSGSSDPAFSRTSTRATWAGNRTLHTRRAQALRALLPRPALRSPARGVLLACGLSAEPRAPPWPRSEGTQATPDVLSLTPGPTFWHALSGQQLLPTSSYASILFADQGGTALAPLSSAPALSPGLPWAHARLILFLLQHLVGLSFAAHGPCPRLSWRPPRAPKRSSAALPWARGAPGNALGTPRAVRLCARLANCAPLPRRGRGFESALPGLASAASSALLGTPGRTPPGGRRAPARPSPY